MLTKANRLETDRGQIGERAQFELDHCRSVTVASDSTQLPL